MGTGKTEQMQLLTGLAAAAFANLRHECSDISMHSFKLHQRKVHALENRLVLGTPETHLQVTE